MKEQKKYHDRKISILELKKKSEDGCKDKKDVQTHTVALGVFCLSLEVRLHFCSSNLVKVGKKT